ncbi:MAG: hypothetical protein JWQ98_3712 [Chlorobi bacterium]|nr:hypothetical protein [Chlorobiota bacterium]
MNRRSFLTSFAIPGLAQEPHGTATSDSRDTRERSLLSVPSLDRYTGPWNRATRMHLLRRTILAPKYSEVLATDGMSMDQLVDQLTAPLADVPAPPEYTARWMDASSMYYDSNRLDISHAFRDELRRWWSGLMIDSPLNVRERMALFWHNHFACDGAIDPDHRLIYIQNQLFRKFAVGDFKQLVRLVSVDRAMLYYLNGITNRADAINENYARELQELFTLGVMDNNGTPNYTQQDVREAARILTGWSFIPSGINDTPTCYDYWHDTKDKVIYGQTIKGTGYYGDQELDKLIDLIFSREQTARYIVRKLYRFFVYTDTRLTPFTPIAREIEDNIIAPLAEEFRSSNWNVGAVLKKLFLSGHFYDRNIIGASIKSPVDIFVGTARAMTTGPRTAEELEFLTHVLQRDTTETGQEVFDPPGVQGWQFYRTWISSTTLPQRRFYTDALIDGENIYYQKVLGAIDAAPTQVYGHTQLPVLPFAKQFASFDNDVEQLVADITEHLLAYPASARLKQQLLDALLQGQPAYEWQSLENSLKEARLNGMLKFLMRSSNYQLM